LTTLFKKLEDKFITLPPLEQVGSFAISETLGTGLLIATEFLKIPDNYLLLCSNLYSVERLYEFLLNFVSENDVLLFPADELLRAEALTSSKELMAQRLYVLGELLTDKKKIVIAHPSSFLRFLPNPASFKKAIINFRVGDRFNLEELKTKLASLGYQRVNKIDQPLQFALRGDVLDIFSINESQPVRIEFFDEEIESIKHFQIATQSSTEQLQFTSVLPASDVYFSNEELDEATKRLKSALDKRSKEISHANTDTLYEYVSQEIEAIMSRRARLSSYKYFGFALDQPYSLLSYFDPRYVFFEDYNEFKKSSDNLIVEASEYLDGLASNYMALTNLQEYMELEQALPEGTKIVKGQKFLEEGQKEKAFLPREVVASGAGVASMPLTVESYLKEGKRVVIALGEAPQRNIAKNFLVEAHLDYEEVEGLDLPKKKLAISNLRLNEGFDLSELGIVYLSPKEAFGQKASNNRFSARFRGATILRSFEELNPGDYVVHETKGIGQFQGIVTLETSDIKRDYLRIAYAKEETLYVPLEQFRLVRKWSGREGAAPRLSSLTGNGWEKRKKVIKERVNDLAERLLLLYGNRAKLSGFAFPKDDEFQKKFEDEFPYELTPDQLSSLLEIKADMERPEIMDRLLCGDVGFGKTEVAFRAAFKAILAGKQVAILCPTTLLARQHFEVALRRFGSFGVHIKQLSRLVPSNEQRETIKDIGQGKVDIIIGTHRLLSKEVAFKDLGLLIVDEEQRFGVEQKEKIKEYKKNVDVLTLSATPIPRTLQMSLIGVRALSQIVTPPEARMPIETYVTPYKEETINELIKRELARKGQVFFVHNKVYSIYAKASELSRAIPGANIGVVHGQMNKEDIEDVMEKFYDGQINLLVCSSIVENGIDVPNANMIIVEDADHFGLSQLYQIKGRVGRGNRIAYAYLTYKENKEMTEEASKRLKAIQEFTELGSGYKIAQRDLMIRGAGDLLGPEQAGFIDSIGFDLYLKMLSESIEEKTTGKPASEVKAKSLFSLDTYIPQEYAIDSDKIEIYQSIQNCKSEEELDKYAAHLVDVYGKSPSGVLLLIKKQRIDILSGTEEFSSVEEGKDYVDILLSEEFMKLKGVVLVMFQELEPYLNDLKITFSNQLPNIRMQKKGDWMKQLYGLLKVIHALYTDCLRSHDTI